MREICTRRTRRRALPGVVLGVMLLLVGPGCHQHYHYYNSNPACPPGASMAPSSVQYGSVCEVPAEEIEGGNVVSSNSSRSTTIVGTRTPERVVVSQPRNSAPFSSWRKSDPDGGLATTSVEGGIDESTIKQ